MECRSHMPIPASLTAPLASLPPVLLQDAAPAGQGGPNLLLLFAVPLAIFWFMVIWPERKEKKRKAAMLDALQKNDRVLTTFGMYATVAAVNENDVTLKLDDGNTRARVLKSTIASVITPTGDEAAKDKG
jgi:preprotein translocase subunit YajC